MSNYLKIYDFFISHKRNNTNTTYYHLATDSPELVALIATENEVSENIQRQLVFDSFLRKLTNDLNIEVLKNTKTKKIVKKSKYYQNQNIVTREIETDYSNKVIYGILHSGKITDNAILEKRRQEGQNEDEFEYDLLNGDRIYDDFFFMLHVSFSCNVARLFILTRKENTNIDTIFKKYLKDTLFSSENFKKTKSADFVSDDYKQAILGRSIVSSISISKADTIISESDNIEYEVEIKLKPKTDNIFMGITETVVNQFRKGKVIIENDSAEDVNSEIKFNIKDPNTKIRKTISFGNQDNFTPRLVLQDEEILDENSQIDIQKLKDICLEYIVYENDVLQ